MKRVHLKMLMSNEEMAFYKALAIQFGGTTIQDWVKFCLGEVTRTVLNQLEEARNAQQGNNSDNNDGLGTGAQLDPEALGTVPAEPAPPQEAPQ